MPRTTKRSAPPRRRRTAEEARAAILDAAERMLIESGPAGIRLQQVAQEVGVSHPTVLHHFGSREELVKSVVARASATLHADVVEAIGRAPSGAEEVAELIERVFAALGTRGHARAIAWLALSGEAVGADGVELDEVAKVTHALRRQRRGQRPTPPLEDTRFTIQLALFALFAQAVAGPMLTRGSSHEGPRDDERFRKWLARLLLSHLQEGGA